METLSKFLDIEYIKTRIKELPAVQRGDVKVDVYKSDIPNSKSIYVNIYCVGQNGEWYKCYTLRISDHRFDDFNYAQFIVNPDNKLTKYHRQRLTSLLEKTIEMARLRGTYKKIEHLSDDREQTTILP